MIFRLYVLRGRDLGTEFPLDDGQEAVIGRGPDCTARLDDPTVSREHCRIAVEGGQVTVYDADSRWGTLVNGQLTGCRELKPGDRITVGETELQLEVEGSPDATTLARPSDSAREEDESASLASVSVDALAADDGHARAGPPPESDGRELVGDVAQLVGTRFARFEVKSVVARAQTGVVFRAAEAEEDRTVALKVFYAENFGDTHNMQRFLRAVRTMLPVRHENLVALYHAGRSQGLCYTASEFVEGESAAEMIRRIGIGGMLEWQHAFGIAVDVARALEFAADHGIIHRNVTPRNILVRSSDRRAKLGDLVLAKALGGTRQEQITRPGELVGPLEYLSPEQTTGARPPDARSDLYCLGATLYALLTGRPPLEGRTPTETLLKIQTDEPVKPTRYHLSIPSRFEDLVLCMLAKRPEDRPQTAAELLKGLDQVAKLQGLYVRAPGTGAPS